MTEFRLFQFLSTVLNDVEKQRSNQQYSEEERLERRKKIIAEFKKYYFRSGGKVNVPNFSDPMVQSFYIREYVPCHASIVCQVIEQERSKELTNLFDNDHVRMVSIGAGPGTDLLGVIKFCALQNNSKNFALTCLLTDIAADQWGAVWKLMEARLLESELDFEFTADYAMVNIQDGTGLMESRQHFESADLFTISYVLSELPDNEHGFQKKYFDELIAMAKVGSIFVFMDNNTEGVITKLDKIISNNSLESVFKRACEWSVGYEEEKNDLGPAHNVEAYGGQKPALQKNCIVRIAVKRNVRPPTDNMMASESQEQMEDLP